MNEKEGLSMHRYKVFQLFLISFVLLATSCERQTDSDGAKKAELQQQHLEGEVRERIQDYINAINQRDLKKVTSQWSEEAVYRNPLSGNLVQGKSGIREEFEQIFDEWGDATIDIKIKSVRFPFEDKAVTEGLAQLVYKGKSPIISDYKITHIKRDGQWLILNVSSLDLETPGQELEE